MRKLAYMACLAAPLILGGCTGVEQAVIDNYTEQGIESVMAAHDNEARVMNAVPCGQSLGGAARMLDAQHEAVILWWCGFETPTVYQPSSTFLPFGVSPQPNGAFLITPGAGVNVEVPK